MSMKDLNSEFLSLLRYVSYIVDKKPKVQQFLSCLPFHIKDIIEYDNPKTLQEAMQKANFCYEHNRKRENMPNWKTQRSKNFEQRKKGFTPNRNFGHNNSHKFPNKNFQGNNLKGNSQENPTVTRNKEFTNNHSNYVKNNQCKEQVKCWKWQGPRYASVCPNIKKTVNNIHVVQKETMVGDLARGMLGINVAQENR